MCAVMSNFAMNVSPLYIDWDIYAAASQGSFSSEHSQAIICPADV